MKSPVRPGLRLTAVLAPLLALSLTACGGSGTSPGYDEGYVFGRDGGPGGHLGEGAVDVHAESECGEHAETDGVRTSPVWMRGCVAGALGLPRATESP